MAVPKYRQLRLWCKFSTATLCVGIASDDLVVGRRLTVWWRSSRQGRCQPRTGVVHVQHERTKPGVTDHTHRCRIRRNPLETVQVYPQRVGDDRLDDVAVRAGQPQRVATMLLGQPRVMVTD